jgi:hypothetical protein
MMNIAKRLDAEFDSMLTVMQSCLQREASNHLALQAEAT